MQRQFDAWLICSANKVDGANDTSWIGMMDHMPGPRKDIEHASRHFSVQPTRLRFQIDDRIGIAGEDGDGTIQFGIAIRACQAFSTENASSASGHQSDRKDLISTAPRM
jgi:hypothetical protein